MKVRVQLFAGLAERAGAREWTIADLADRTTLGELLAMLRVRHPFLSTVPHAAARNRAIGRNDELLRDGDEVALLPPVSGG